MSKDNVEVVEKTPQELEEAIRSICHEIDCLFQNKPINSNGQYFHLGVCSGNLRKPIGASGCACKSSDFVQHIRNYWNTFNPSIDVTKVGLIATIQTETGRELARDVMFIDGNWFDVNGKPIKVLAWRNDIEVYTGDIDVL
jgi:hypothetical protein